MLTGILLTIHIVVCIALVAVILLQQSEGGALGMGGGGGGFMTARGAGNFLSRTTAVLATAFFVLSFVLTILAGRAAGGGSLVDRFKVDAIDLDQIAPRTAPNGQTITAPVPTATPNAPPSVGAAPAVTPSDAAAGLTAPRPQVRTAPQGTAAPASQPSTAIRTQPADPVANANPAPAASK